MIYLKKKKKKYIYLRSALSLFLRFKLQYGNYSE